MTAALSMHNGQTVALADVPVLSVAELRDHVIRAAGAGARLGAFFGNPLDASSLRLFAILVDGFSGNLLVLATDVADRYPALTPDCPQAHWFEREIAEQWGVRPLGHPWLKPIRFHRSYRAGEDAWGRPADAALLPGVTDFFQVAGEEVHEVAVGPVHAGIIEPGHFRFQCHGEEVLHLEISLGFQHRGVESGLLGGPDKRSLHFIETLAGDTSVAHAIAYSEILESLGGVTVTARAQSLRGIALELERLANHTGDLGALATDIGFLPTSSYCGRIRGDFLNTTALLCGNRFGRSLIRPGGLWFDVDGAQVSQILERLEAAEREVTNAADLLWNTSSVMARFEETGPVSVDTCRDLGLVGVAARACGLERDCRYELPSGIFRFAQIPVSTWDTGDVFARAYVRWLEIKRSAAFIRDQLGTLPAGHIHSPVPETAPSSLSVSLVEGWRGEVCHVAITDKGGRFARYKVVDPSFHNWMGLAIALRNQQIADFPLCNKSFNLSYCGHDL
ncbi:MAG: NADH-quinone oxidoreductase subunit C [Candidatus Schekmanbacteria bacterium]|nr:NADH-quinone oxidoreductase subunit C [Candidatus Schekmanbacteria bacterium]